jgi:glycosyltransferase involved in cell wall biosynthesis
MFSARDSSRPICLVVGRVSKFPANESYISALDEVCGTTGELRLLTVCRIAADKRESLRCIYSYVGKNLAGVFHLHVGVVQDANLGANLKRIHGGRITILSEIEFTERAANSIHWANAFCGIGRSVIEAMSCGKPSFVPVVDKFGEALLVAVTKENWQLFAHHNFTDRVSYKELEAAGEIVTLLDFVNSSEIQKALALEATEIYEMHFRPDLFLGDLSRFIEKALFSRISTVASFRIRLFNHLYRILESLKAK